MSKSTAISVIVHESEPEQVVKVLLAFGELQAVHQRLKLMFQAAQGGCLIKLQELYGFTRGHHGSKTATCGFSSWSQFIKATFGFSDDKALRLIGQYKAMVPLIEKLSADEKQRVADFLRRPMLHLPAPDLKALEKVTNKIATMQDEIDEAAEVKFLRQPHGSALKNRKAGAHLPDGDEPPPLTMEERVQMQLDLFGKFSLGVDEVVEEGGRKVHLISKWPTERLDEAIKIAKNTLTTLVKVRKARE